MLTAPPLHRSEFPPRVRLVKRAPLPAPAPLDHVFDVRAHGRRRVLILDYDGTLAPVRLERAERGTAAPYAGARELLARIRAHPDTRLVIVGACPAREMAEQLGLVPRPEIWGVYGWEHIAPNGQLVRAIVPATARATLDRVRALAPAIEAAGGWLEDRHAAIAVHWRGRSAEQLRAIQALLAPLAPAQPARLDGVAMLPLEGPLGGSAGVEFRPRGTGKGSVVRNALRAEPRDAVVAYIGDDLSDEEAFTALRGRGLGVRVLPAGAAREAQRRPSAAGLTLRAPDELLAFLSRWVEQPGRGAGAPAS